ncbi:MAG: RHS repeat-associated core domain-containing protein [Archangium sp.]|nr:RHS repeat-associated core domain-containing protein [Archangium sp.]MDP3571635.1 RHS repeat-associated core domain-containing protein [Archangium sp.]
MIGTFYKTQRSCDLGIVSDAMNRTLRVEGPCIVASEAATGCSGAYPTTEFYFENESGGRLTKVARYPTNSGNTCGTALNTSYSQYSVTGLPGQVVDESGAVRKFEYSVNRVTKETLVVAGGDQVKEFSYEAGRLTKIRYPRGNYELFCYRSIASDTCTGGESTPLLQWKAKTDSALSWTERIDYQYWPDDGLKRETHRVPSGNRSEKFYSRNAHGQLTYEQTGGQIGSPSTYALKRNFDGNGNVVSIGQPFAHAPDFCAVNSAACSWLKYDRADRLAEIDSHPNGVQDSNSERTCMEYDDNGNVRRVTSGCSGSVAAPMCPINVNFDGGTAPCNPGVVDYEVDDFGNTTKITFPWTVRQDARQIARYEFDALGNLIKKQGAEMFAAGTMLEYAYDSIGRLLSVTRTGGAPILLYALSYDSFVPESGCPAPLFSGGKLVSRNDSFGMTWYLYDEAGRVTREVRRRGSVAGCGNGTATEDKNPHTSYSYTLNGDLEGITYPHGRKVNYVYPSSGSMDRPGSIVYHKWNGSSWNKDGAVAFDSIAWEPYGGLRAYRFAGNGHWVEYYRGGSLEAASTATSCSSLPATYGSYDFSGRTRGLFVSDGPMTLGTPNGNIFKQVYTWDADQLVVQQTCHRSSGSVVKETFGYDKTQRLVSHNDVNMGTSLSQVFDKRGNRTNSTLVAPQSCQQNVPFWTAAWQVDMPFSTRWGPAFGSTCNATAPSNGSYNYYYDRDGRRTDTWDEFNLYHVTTGFPQSTLGAGLDSVYQTAVVSGGNYLSNQYVNGTYSYFYDAFGRRRAKTTPWNTTDEFFYDLGHQMLTDRGSNTVAASATEYPEDDYIWLDGRPLMIVRSKFIASTMARAADDPSLTCQRNGEVGLCGSFELVTDYLGKPVVSFDRGGTAGTSTYEVLGYSNRREYRVGSPHGSAGTTPVATLTPTMPPGFDGPLRVLMSRSNYSTSSSVSLAGVVQSPLQGNKSHVWSDWQYSSTNSWALSWTGSGSDYGFDMEAYEVRAKQAWVWWAWTPLRFPGQYFDPETELHENWNRYYDPSTGRYLSPEPMLQDLSYVVSIAKGGVLVPAYSYAFNNTLHYTDETGLFALNGKCTNWDEAMQEAKKRAGCGSDDQKSCACAQKLKECGSSGCDICKILDNADPAYIVKNLKCDGKDASGCSHRKANDFFKVEFDQALCSPPAPASELATVILHEAAHFCREQTRQPVHDPPKGNPGCRAADIAEACQ